MADYMMIMKAFAKDRPVQPSDPAEWASYVKTLVATGKFRGGSALGNGVCVTKGQDLGSERVCAVTGFMRFEADSIDEVRALLVGNPVHEAGGEIELLELVKE